MAVPPVLSSNAGLRVGRPRPSGPAQDDLLTAIRKLGGLDTEVDTDWQGRLSHLGDRRVGMPGIERPGKGRSLDDLAEVLMEMGYLRTRDAHELEERLSEAETGTKHFSLAIEDEARARHAAEAWEAMGDAAAPDVSTRDEILSAAYADYSGEAAKPGPPGEGQAPFSPALMELADDAEGVDPGAVERILEESATQGLSEQDTARRLLAIIRGAHGEERGADTAGPDARATRPRGEPEAGSGASQADPRGDRPGRGAVQGEQIGLTEPRDERAQALHDRQREVDSRLRGQEDVPAGQGGDLVSPVQADITDVRPPGERPPRSPAPPQTPADAGAFDSAVDAAAAETDATPTEGQKQAGNYRKGHVSLHGLDISIENPRGSERSGTDRDGRRWTSQMAHHYGYIRKTEGSDGEQVDVFLGPQAEDSSMPVFIVDQVNPRSRRFDEHKVLIGFPDEAAARAGYLANYQDGWQGLGGITEVSLDDFKQWLREGDTTKRFRPASSPPGRATRAPSPAEPPADAGVSTSGGPAGAQRSQAAIADFGERIEGARKDYYTAYAEKMAQAQGADIAAEPLSKSWPEPDYQRLLDDGADPWAVGFVRAARDEVPNKPRQSWKLASWVAQVELLRDTSNRLLSGDIPKGRVLSLLEQSKYRRLRESVGGRAELYQEVGHKASLKGIRVTLGRYGVYNGEHFNPPKEVWTVEQKAKATAMSNFPRVIAEGDTRAQAIANFKKRIESIELNPPAAKQIKFRVWSQRGEGGFHVGVKIGARYVTVEKFDDVASARKAIQTDYDALAAKLERMKEVPSERRETNEPRVGVDHRGGADVTPAQFQETFGFRGGQFGSTLLRSQAEAQQKLNETYDALMDMAGILGLPPRALSLNGELAIAFGARGRGGKDAAAAHYEPGDTVTPGRVVINLTRRRGAGSLAHEWWHALDNYFTRLRGQRGEDQYLTESAEPRGEGVRPEMIDAFQRVVQAINRTRIRERSRKLDQMRAKAYWSTGREMSARAFESFVIEKLRDQGASNDYLANIVSKEYWDAATALGLEKEGTYPYPEAAEVPAVREAFDHFFDTVETRETDSGVAMFARRLRRGEPDKQDYIVPETPEYADNDTGDLAYSPRSAEQRGVEQLPIRLTVGEARGSHRGFGMMHMAQEGDSDARRMAPGYTPDQAENYARHVAMLARSFDEIYTEGNRVIFRSQRANEAIVTQRIRDRETGESFYSVLTVVPSTRPVWGDPVWRAGRAQLPADRTLKPGAPGLSPDQESQRSGHQTLGEVQTERFNIARERERTQARRAGGATRVTYKKRRRIVRTKDDDFRASLSQGSASSEGVSAERKSQAEAIVAAARGRWKNAPRVHVLSDMTEAPEEVRAADEQERSEGASGEPEGFFYRGEVYLVLDGLEQRPGESFAEAVFRVLAHESLGHAGLRGLFGKDLDPILRQVAFARRKEVAAKAEQYGYAVTMVDARAAVERESDGTLSARQLEARARERLDADRRRAAEEVLADMAQATPDVGFVRRAVEAIRQALRKLYMAMPADVKKALGQGRFIKWVNGLSDAEIIQNFIIPARRFIQEGPQSESAGAEAPAFARAPATDSDAFRRIDRGEVGRRRPADQPRDERGRFTVSEEPAWDQEFRDTERAYGGREAHERAREAGRTNLNYRQWVQVRTPAFKRFFGDWEALRGRTELLGMDAIDVPGLGARLSGEALRERANEAYRRAARAGSVNMRDGRSVNLTTVGLKKTRSHSADRRVLDLLPSIREVLEGAVPLASKSHVLSDPGDSIRAWHYYGAKVRLGGRELYARLVVRESINGEIYYDNDLSGIEEVGGRGGDATPAKPEAAPVSADTYSLRDLVGSVNPDTVSKVTDPETGEPLVVHHGTSADIGSFRTPAFFAPDPDAAGSYAAGSSPNVMPVYLKIENPLRVEGMRDLERALGDRVDLAQFDYDWEALEDRGVMSALQDAGYDGVDFRGDQTPDSNTPHDSWVVFDPTQIKSATGNRGTFDPGGPDIRFQRRGPASTSGLSPAEIAARERRARRRQGQSAPGGRPSAGSQATGPQAASGQTFGTGGFAVDEGSRLWQDIVFKAQDRFSYLAKAQKAAARARGLDELPEGEDAYLAELRYHGQAGTAIEDFQRDHVDPILKMMSDSGITVEEADRFLRSRHAAEANAHLARINPDRWQTWSRSTKRPPFRPRRRRSAARCWSSSARIRWRAAGHAV